MGRFYACRGAAKALMRRNNPDRRADLSPATVASRGQKLQLFQMFCGIDKIARRDAIANKRLLITYH
jgi:hypothetical protein